MEALTVQVQFTQDFGWCWHVLRPAGGIVESGYSYSRTAAIHEGWAVAQWYEGWATRTSIPAPN